MEVTVRHLEKVRFEIAARHHTLISDQPAANGGQDEGMTPPELFLASLGSCAAFYAAAYFNKKGLTGEPLTVKVTAEKAGPPARLDGFRIEVQVSEALSAEHRLGVDQAVHHCLIHNTLLRPPQITIAVNAAVGEEAPCAA